MMIKIILLSVIMIGCMYLTYSYYKAQAYIRDVEHAFSKAVDDIVELHHMNNDFADIITLLSCSKNVEETFKEVIKTLSTDEIEILEYAAHRLKKEFDKIEG